MAYTTVPGSFWCAVPSLVLTETGGTSGAWVTGLQFHLNTANPVDGTLPGGGSQPVHKRVEAGATSELVAPQTRMETFSI